MACVNLSLPSIKGTTTVTSLWQAMRTDLATQHNGRFIAQPAGTLPLGAKLEGEVNSSVIKLLDARGCIERQLGKAEKTTRADLLKILVIIEAIRSQNDGSNEITREQVTAYLRDNLSVETSGLRGQFAVQSYILAIEQTLEILTFLSIEQPANWGTITPSAAFEVFPKEADTGALAAAEGQVAQLEGDLAAARAGRPAPEAPSWTAAQQAPQAGDGEDLTLPLVGAVALAAIGTVYGLRNAGMDAGHAVNREVKKWMQVDPKKITRDWDWAATALWRMRNSASDPLPDNVRANLKGPITKKEALTLHLQYLREQYTVAKSGRAIAFQIDIVNERLAVIAKAEAKAEKKAAAARAKPGRSWFSGWHLPHWRLPRLSLKRKPAAPEIRTSPGPAVEIRDAQGQLTQVRVWRRPHSSRTNVWTLSAPMTAAEVEARIGVDRADPAIPPMTVKDRLTTVRKNMKPPISPSHNMDVMQRELAAEVLELAHLEAALALFRPRPPVVTPPPT